MAQSLIAKYNIPGPRYTSYPTVPYWDEKGIDLDAWKKSVKLSFDESNAKEGISLYVHLPFCESLCTFCGCNKRITKNHEVEDPYITAVLKEWDLYLELLGETPIISEIHFGGGTPTFFSPNSLRKLILGLTSKGIIPENHSYSFEGHPNNTKMEHLKVMNELGFNRASYGVQDFDPKVQKTINRIQPFEVVEEVINNTRAAGYTSTSFDLVYGLPHQTKESIIDTINKVRELKPEIGYQLLLDSGYKEIGMDHFALETDSMYVSMKNKELHRNFMGYSASKTQLMIGLGVSSISDSWYAFAQNVKTVEEYYKIIEEGEIPIFRGHELTEEDLVIRRHILDIMCHYETSWADEESYHEIIDECIPRLTELIEDGFLELGNKSLKVTEAGKPFIRNICMAFDVRLIRNKPQTQLFSMTI